MTDEQPLGGNLTQVVRVGDTVRRPWRRWSPAVHRVLVHLEDVGLPDVPRFLGRDDQGREVLSYVEGDVALRPWPATLRTLDGIRELGALIGRFHEAMAGYVPPDDEEWAAGPRAPEPGDIVIHGDLGPWNVIWREGRQVGLIDFDFAEPAAPLTDLAILAIYAVPLRDEDNARACGFEGAPDRRARLHALIDGYGTTDPAAVVDAAEEHLARDGERTARLGAAGIDPWDHLHRIGNVQDAADRLAWIRAHRAGFDH